MTPPAACLLDLARAGRPAVWVRIEQVRGSAPREVGASMVVDAGGRVAGTIGGGHLEFQAIDEARRMLALGGRARLRAVALGPSLGQCCGGAVRLSLRRVDAGELAWVEALAVLERDGGGLRLATDARALGPHTRVLGPEEPAGDPSAPTADDEAARFVSSVSAAPWPVWVFGAGHVGDALVRVLATLPASIVWVDPRSAPFPAGLPPAVVCVESDSPVHEVRSVPPGADVLVMTHSHALDLALCAALLAREDLGSVGVIGSATKAARFRSALARRGLPADRIARLQCPIGTPPADGTRRALDRHPGAIAVSVAFALWARRRRLEPLAAREPA